MSRFLMMAIDGGGMKDSAEGSGRYLSVSSYLAKITTSTTSISLLQATHAQNRIYGILGDPPLSRGINTKRGVLASARQSDPRQYLKQAFAAFSTILTSRQTTPCT